MTHVTEDYDVTDDVAPLPEEQLAIVTTLEEDEESLHVYSVSKDWYQRWRLWVGLKDHAADNYVGLHDKKTKTTSGSGFSSSSSTSSSHTAEVPSNENTTNSPAKATSKECSKSPSRTTTPGEQNRTTSPGLMTMDLADDDNNMYVDEKIWKCWVNWFGVAESHELDRRNWASDDKDFEICMLSPYCGLIENPVKTFDISEECGYIEIQLRQIFRVAGHRPSRLWVCEKARHARFQPLLIRQKEICSHKYVEPNKNYILALEMANLDESWPTHVPGEPVGSFDRYADLTDGRGPGKRSCFWERELSETLNTVFGGISNELKETASGVVTTVKCVTALKENDLDAAKELLTAKTRKYEESRAIVEEMARDLRDEESNLETDRERLKTEQEAFQERRHKFAEELVRMHTINMIQDSRVKLNIGGHVFMTSTLTLTKDPESMLAAMFSGRHALKQEEDGSYFLDRDGTHFRYVLNYLRDGSFRPGSLPSDVTFLNELYTEAEYFQLNGLISLLTTVIESVDESGDGSSADGKGGGCSVTIGPGPCHGRMGSFSTGKRTPRKVNVPPKTGGPITRDI